MGTVAAIWMAVEGLVFLAWAAMMFRVLFALRRDTVDRSGRMFPGPGATLRGFRAFLSEDAWRRDRRILGGLTLGLVCLVFGSMAVIPVR